jgi:peroxiredoxin
MRVLVVAALLAAAAYAAGPRLELRDTEGKLHPTSEWNGAKAVLLFFVTTDCPIGNSYVPEMNRIHEAYAPRGVRIYAVQSDVTIPDAQVASYARDFHYGFPLLLDPRQALVKLANAAITPQAAVLSPEGKVLYLGRIDNRVADFGKQRYQATEQDLREALDAVLAGRPVGRPFTKSVGCAINRVP